MRGPRGRAPRLAAGAKLRALGSTTHAGTTTNSPSGRTHRALDYAAAAVIVVACTLLSALSHWWAPAETNLVMIYLAGVALTAARFGHGPALAAIVLSVASHDYFFVPPMFAFAIVEPHYALTLAIMVAIGLLISELTRQLQKQLRASRMLERRSTQSDVAAKAVSTIVTPAKTGQVGDGGHLMTNLARVIRVRTGETGPAAI